MGGWSGPRPGKGDAGAAPAAGTPLPPAHRFQDLLTARGVRPVLRFPILPRMITDTSPSTPRRSPPVLVLLLLTLATASPGATGPLRPADRPLRPLVADLTDAALDGEVPRLEEVRRRLAAELDRPADPPRKARLHYLLALADWHLTQLAATDRGHALAVAHRGLDELAQAEQLDPDLAAAFALHDRTLFLLSLFGGLDPTTGPVEAAALRRQGRTADPDDPLVRLVDAVNLYYAPPSAGGDRRKGLAHLREATDHLREAAGAGDPHARGWLAVALGWLGMLHLGTGEVELARHDLEASLQVHPGYWVVTQTLLPMTERVEPGVVPDLEEGAWELVAEDPAGDGRRPDLPDLRALRWHHREGDDRLWFRLDLGAPADASRFGVNLAFDVDHDQSTGASWWGGNTDFTFDRLVTVWVTRVADGGYRGAVGVGDAAGVAAGRYLGVSQGSVSFQLDREGQAIVVGFPARDLGATGKMSLLAAVGSNTDWNDVVKDAGACEIEVPAPHAARPSSAP
jgi:hypothetical protein